MINCLQSLKGGIIEYRIIKDSDVFKTLPPLGIN